MVSPFASNHPAHTVGPANSSILTSVLQSNAGVDSPHMGEERGRSKLAPALQIPKNRSTGNLALSAADSSEKARIRFSFDAGAAAAEYDSITR